MAIPIQVTFDAADPDGLATFWATALGYKKQDPPLGFATWPEFLRTQGFSEDEMDDASAIVDPDGSGPRIFFQRVPESKSAKNRVHLDVNIGGPDDTPVDERRRRSDAHAELLITAGARRLAAKEEHGEYWVVMQDPEGNEFCLQ
ncbi:MAG: VOC family protein [Chloroflexota bacterium]|nr:MAG: glyoxalase [Chloroflexota bacterium]